MTRKARMWIGVTLLLVIAVNYILIGLPLFKRDATIKEQSKTILIRQVKSGKVFKSSTDDYMLEVLRREKASIENKIMILNLASVTLVIIIASWTIFGIAMHRRM